jgi:hypothetical protein
MVQFNACLHLYPHILKEGYENANARLQCMNFTYFIILNFRGKATRGSKYFNIKVNSNLSCWCEVLKLNGGNSNNKVKACRPSLRLLAFTEEQERELSTIRRHTTCTQTYLSTNTYTLA